MQKQQAVILYAALQGIGSPDELLPEAAIADFVNEIHHLLETTLRFHHGKLKRFTGDAALGVFYGGQSRSPAALHALDAAFAIKEQLQARFDEKLPGQPFGVKMGLANGMTTETTIGSGESRQTAILGEAVNHAERICRFCSNEQALTDQAVYEAAGEYYAFEKLEPIPLKGGTETLPIFEPLKKKHKKLDLKISPQRKIVSEMVGRSREMEQLEGLISDLAAGKGAIVNIVGKAGIGKSRLIAEMKVQPVMEKVLMLEGRALSTGQNLSYHPITNLIRSWAGITEEDAPTQASEKLFRGIKHNTPEQANEIYAFVATMMGLPLEGKHKERVKGIEGEALEKLILKNLRDLIIAAAKDKPRIYLVEDMHWSDASSIAMFESLYKLSLNHPVMFINVLRPGYKETGDYILKYLVDQFPGDHSTISVSSLRETDSEQLIINLLRKVRLPAETEKMIIRKTEGNPFFIEEVIRSFIDEGIIEIHDNDFRVNEKINQANIPETINEVILSRVDKLDEKTKELLKTASVIGRNFYFKVLEEAADTIGELDERLEYLKDVQLIGESKKKDEIEYLFKHALAQQATYESIVMNTKKEMHLKIARSIEKVFAENLNEFYATLAHHYEMAENKEKTEEYLLKAGDEAIKSGASSEALNFYKDALDRIPPNRKQETTDIALKNLEFKVGFAYHAAGKNNEAREFFEMLSEKYFRYKFLNKGFSQIFRGIKSMLKFIFIIHNQYLFFKKEVNDDFHLFARTIKHWGEATSTADTHHFAFNGFHALEYLSRYQLHKSIHGLTVFAESGALYMWTGISFKVCRKMLDYAREGGADQHPVSRASYRFILKMHEFMTGKWKVDEDHQQLYEMSTRIGHFWPNAIYVMYSGLVNIELGKFEAMLDNLEKLNEISDTFDNTHSKAQMYRLQAGGYFRFRKIEQAVKLSTEGIDYTIKTGHTAMLLVIYCYKTQSHLLLGEISEARKALSEVEKVISRHKIITILYTPYLTAKAKLEFEELKLLPENDRNYKSKLKAILKTSDKLISKSKKMAGSLTESYLIRADIHRFLKQNKKALRCYVLAIATGEKYIGRLELSRAYFETGKFLSDPNTKFTQLNGLSAEEYLEKARTMFEEMDLQWDLEEIRKFLR